ncbi:MAG: lysine--tRNA ligase [bacterium]
MTSIEEIREQRIQKIKDLQEKGIEAFPVVSYIDQTNKQFTEDFKELLESQKEVTLGGRILSVRGQGKVGFADIMDGTSDKVQCFLSIDNLSEESLGDFFALIDTSDFIEFKGVAYITKRGTEALLVKEWRLLAKSLRPMPDSWFGLTDEDERYRKRYVDMVLNPELRDMMKRRSAFWNVMRNFLIERDYIEVETPVLENTTGGADAKPFVTHHNALDIDVYLRISAGELWQKRLLVAGLPKTFEIGRIFRNEGMSPEHGQDYTQIEFYEAYSDFDKGMKMVKELYVQIAEKVYGKTVFENKGHTFDLASEWAIYDFSKIIKEKFNIDVHNNSTEEVERELVKNKIDFDKKTISSERGIDLLWKSIRKDLSGPGFLVGIPVYLETLAKKSRVDNRVVERFQIILAGSELGKGFSELNDPLDQEARFKAQQALRDAGDEEAQMADEDYVEAMEYGMPPAFGFGVSERLFSFLEGKTLRECQAFPLMKKRE